MCETDKYLSNCCGASPDLTQTYENGNGICSKCKEHSEFWDEDDNKEYTEDYYLYETIRSSYDKDFKKLIKTINEKNGKEL